MLNVKIAAVMALGLLAASAHAHTRLQSSLPNDGASVTALHELVLEFSEEVHLTAVALRTVQGEEQPKKHSS